MKTLGGFMYLVNLQIAWFDGLEFNQIVAVFTTVLFLLGKLESVFDTCFRIWQRYQNWRKAAKEIAEEEIQGEHQTDELTSNDKKQ
jgi:hypothetical protein